MATEARQHILVLAVAVQIGQLIVNSIFAFTFVHDALEDFGFQNLFNLLFYSELALVPSLLPAVHFFDLVFLGLVFGILLGFDHVVELLLVELLGTADSSLDDLMTVLGNLIVLSHEGIDFAEEPGQHTLLKLDFELSGQQLSVSHLLETGVFQAFQVALCYNSCNVL